MKKIALLTAMVLTLPLLAHDEGHGPKLDEKIGKLGGVLTSVIDEAQLGKKGEKQLIYKAELTREGEDIRVYLYDGDKRVPMERFSKEAKGSMEMIKNKKIANVVGFKLVARKDHFRGLVPRPVGKFNIEVKIIEGKRTLFASFENLD